MIKAHLAWRNWNQEAPAYARADKEGEELVQLWLLPPGASMPEIDRRIESFPIYESVREPFMMGYETNIGGICPEIDDQRIFAGFLKANPSARGNIVIRNNSETNRQRRAAKILKKFTITYGISRKRLHIFYAKLQRPSSYDEPIVEYWYLP